MREIKKTNQSRNYLWIILILIFCLGLIIAGGEHYVNSLRDDLMDQEISDVLTITQQQQRSLDTFISKDRERLHSFAQYFSKSRSDNIDEIQDKLSAFKDIEAIYTVVNLDDGKYCNNLNRDVFHMEGDNLAEYRALTGANIRDPYQSLYSDTMRFGYYERFTFADGIQGIFQKGYDCSEVSSEFSLSFYDGQGLGFAVTRQGDILLRSVDMSGQYSFDNIFDLVGESGSENVEDVIARFEAAVDAMETGTLIFEGKEDNYICAYVPIQSVDNWVLVSIVPMSEVMQEANDIVVNSQSMLMILAIIMDVFLLVSLVLWWVRKRMEQKDREIEYREMQFDIFSTYLSNNTDDLYLMLDPEAECVDYISPNVERVLGIAAADIIENSEKFGKATYITGHDIGYPKLALMEMGQVLEPMMTERVNVKTKEIKYFRETVYCVSLQGRKKIVAYISDRTKERQVEATLTEALNMAKVANREKPPFWAASATTYAPP